MALEELQNGRYRVLRRLGSGGMGEVYLMHDTKVNRHVAIKVTYAQEALYAIQEQITSSMRLFEREVRAVAALDHSNILPVYDFGEEAGEDGRITYMVMPYCADGSFESWLRKHAAGQLAPPRVAALIEQAAEALQYAHEHKVIHLDVKPSNFLLRRNRRDPLLPTLLLADFGIARNFTTISHASRTIRGTPTTMPPEQWSGSPVFASDQYALAVMTYELLVGHPPFTGTLEQLMYRHFSLQPLPISACNPRLPRALDAVLQRALSKKPEERFPAILDFASALSEAASQPVPDELPELIELAQTVEHQVDSPADVVKEVEVTVLASAGGHGEQAGGYLPEAAHIDVAEPIQINPALRQPEERDEPGEFTREEPLMDFFSLTAMEAQEKEASMPETLPEQEQGLFSQASPGEQLQGGPLWEYTSVIEPELPASLQSAEIPLLEPSQAMLDRDLPAEKQSGALARENAAREKMALATLANEQSKVRSPADAPPLVSAFSVRARVLALAFLLVAFLSGLGSAIYLHASGQPVQLLAQKSGPAGPDQPAHLPAGSKLPSVTAPATSSGLNIAGVYNGTFQDTQTGQVTPLSIHFTQKKGSALLTGTVSYNSSSGSYALQGTVTFQGRVIFSVAQPAGLIPYIFYGSVYWQGQQMYLHGNYCRATSSTCSASAGFFNVGPKY